MFKVTYLFTRSLKCLTLCWAIVLLEVRRAFLWRDPCLKHHVTTTSSPRRGTNTSQAHIPHLTCCYVLFSSLIRLWTQLYPVFHYFTSFSLLTMAFFGVTKENLSDGTLDEEELTAAYACIQRMDLTDCQLFSTKPTSTEILAIVARIVPQLSPSSPEIICLRQDITESLRKAPSLRLPRLEQSPSTWPSTTPIMDSLWKKAVEAEKAIAASASLTLPAGVDMREELLVKPFGSLDDPLLVLTSYPTLDPTSTVHLAYGMTNDMSNQCMSRLYTKLGFHVANFRTTGMLHLEVWYRRLDRKLVPGSNTSVLQRMPKQLAKHWRNFTFQCLEQSSSRVAILTGHAANRTYSMYLQERKKPHVALWL